MQFPLTEDMFLAQDPTWNVDREFLRAFIGAVNRWHEGGKKADHSRFCMTADILKTVYKRFYNEEPEGEGIIMIFDVKADYMNDAWQQGLKDSGKVFDMPLEAIQVYPCFTETPPNPLKMELKAYYFKETGHFHSDIMLDEDNNLRLYQLFVGKTARNPECSCKVWQKAVYKSISQAGRQLI